MGLEDFESVREARYNGADILAEREKKEVDFIIDICQGNYEQLKDIFKEKIDGSRELPEKIIYDNVLKSLEGIGDWVRGSVVRGNPPQINLPQIELGWLELNKLRGGKNAYGICYTEKGLEIVNNLKRIRGLCSVEEADKRFRKMVKQD